MDDINYIDNFDYAECKYKLIENYNILMKWFEKIEDYEACQDFVVKIKDVDNQSHEVVRETLKRVVRLMWLRKIESF